MESQKNSAEKKLADAEDKIVVLKAEVVSLE